MKITGLDNRQYSWPPSGHEVNFDDIRPRSELHIRCRNILRSLYPTQPILEEVPLPGSKLSFDFFLPWRKVAIECQGEQHYKYNQHFHRNRMEFARAKNRDKRKKDWCLENNIRLVELPFNENDEEWKEKIIEG